MRAAFKAFILMTAAFITLENTKAQDINNLKKGVVRISNNRSGDVGTGFIVKVDGNQLYIITAAHVVKGNQHPSVYLFNQQRDALQAELLDREDDDIKGLALLRLKVSSTLVTGIRALNMSYTSQLDGGEEVKVIGFPDSTAFWTVGNGNVARIEGRNLVFSGAIRGGNSGGPVIFNGLVIGMVTDVSQAAAYAARGEVIEPYINGVVPNLISLGKSTDSRSKNNASNNEFCQILNELLDASKNGFYSIVGAPTDSENTFHPKIMVPGANSGYVLPKERVYNNLLTDKEKGKVESQFYTVVSKVKECLPKWEEKETTDPAYRFYKFRENKRAAAIVVVYYTLVAQHGNYYLTLSVDIPGPGTLEW